ncbi:uncharacterized protein LOC126788511 [Argentina anserina]|uniref:uncharacterized protein LOC126788511 n=1 Tax=Argentina anserina TaxID=57926 RepID=UPI0021764960|nr:uncharacterized protein LOC126788511 [Potentilla anserina]
MKFFLISCCGVTMTARTTRAGSSPSMSPSRQKKIVSPASGGGISSPAHGRMPSSNPGRGRQSSSSPRVKSPRGFIIPVRQTRSELGLAPVPQRPPRRKSGRPVGSAASALQYSEWTPSLCTIEEDNVVSVRRSGRDRTPSIERAVSEKSGREMSRVQSRSHTNDYGRSSVTVIPAYAPAPFLF